MTVSPNDKKHAIPFKAWTQKVLPTVYDDSLSYGELLYKVLNNVNILVENNNLMVDDIQTLYEYVNEYFENLNVQTEIDNKLEQMYESGQLDTMFKKYLDPKIEEQNDKIDTAVSEQNDKIKVLEERMDTFSSLPDGSTAGDAELQDIRVGYNGKTYPTAGDAVRGQAETLYKDIVNTCEYGHIVVPVENEGFLDSQGNIDTSNTSFRYTNPIEIKQGETIRATVDSIDKNICVIADYNNGNYASPYVISDYTGSKTYEWVATKDTQVCVCYRADEYNFITIADKIVNELELVELIPAGMHVGNLDFGIKGYINATGAMEENDYFLCTDFVPICIGATLKGKLKGVAGNLALYYFYDSNKSPLYGYVGAPINGAYEYEELVEKITDDTIKYVRCSYRNNDTCYAQITFSQIDYTDIRIDRLEKDFYVGYGNDDGQTYFSSLVDCLWEVSKTDGKKVVHIANGTYDVLEELGGMSYVNSKNTTDNKWQEVQPVVNDCKIIGYGNVILTFNLDDSVLQENYTLFSCLNVRDNIELENIEIHSSNCRYAIHDESNNNFTNSKHIYKNVRAYQNVSVGSKGGQTIGCGFSDNAKVYIDNCHFENGRNEDAWSCHANNGCSFVFDNTIFKNTDETHSVRISQNGRTNLNARISNCYIHSGLSIRNEWTDASIEDTTKIELINTKIGNLINGYETIKEPVVSYNTIESTITTLLDVTG